MSIRSAFQPTLCRQPVLTAARRAVNAAFLVIAISSLPVGPGNAASAARADEWPAGPRDVLLKPEVEAAVDRLLATLTLEEKVGQMIQGDIEAVTPADLREFRLGSILAGGNGAPGKNVRATAADWLALTDSYARAAMSEGTRGHAPIPLLFGIDAMHGHAHIPGATVFPHNVGLGAAHDPELITRIGRATAEEVSATGIDWTFAPTVAVVRDVRWGRSYESYSEDPRLVAQYAAAMVTGLQGAIGSAEFQAPGRTVASVKHFMGDGGTLNGRDQFDNRSPSSEFIRVHSAGYPPAIAAGALTVMASYNGWNGVKMHANHFLLTDVLKGRFGFNGFVVGDWNAQEEVPGCTKFDCPAVIRAGLDMFMAPDSWRELYRSTIRHVKSGALPKARIDDAVRRILRVKMLAGLFERPLPSARVGAGASATIGSAAHRSIAREAVRKSLVLLKNEHAILPLDPHGHVLVAGSAADDIGRQSGGWTIDWQGAHNSKADFPGGTSVYAGLKAAIEAGGGTVELSPGGQSAVAPTAAVVVFGERPYAEFEGDRENLDFSAGDRADLETMRRLRARHIPVVAIFLSGRPMWTNPEMNASDAFVAAWLPGSEGEGIADVLVRGGDGKPRYDFHGRLGFSWPATPLPATLDSSDTARGALFARGYGLTYADTPRAMASLPETAAPAAGTPGAELLFGSGRTHAPWSLYVSDPTGEVRLTTADQASPAGAATMALKPDGVRVEWSGSARGGVRIGGRATDLRGLAHDNGVVEFRVRIDNAEPASVQLSIRCSVPGGAELPLKGEAAALTSTRWSHCRAPAEPVLDISRAFAEAVPGKWTTIAVPLACFAAKGAELDAVTAPFLLSTNSRLTLTFADVRLTRRAAPLSCPGA